MKKSEMFVVVIIAMIIGGAFMPQHQVDSATLTKGYTFATTETVTAAKLHSLIDSATLSAIVSADITDGTIVTADLANNSVTGAKVTDGTLEGGDLSNRTITATQIATNAITDIELAANQFLKAGTWSFSNVTISANSIGPGGISGVTTSAGAGDSGKIPKLNASGVLDSSMLSATAATKVSRDYTTATGGNADVWTEIMRITNTPTSGFVTVQAWAGSGTTSIGHIRVKGISGGSTLNQTFGPINPGSDGLNMGITAMEIVTNSVIYVCETAQDAGAVAYVDVVGTSSNCLRIVAITQ